MQAFNLKTSGWLFQVLGQTLAHANPWQCSFKRFIEDTSCYRKPTLFFFYLSLCLTYPRVVMDANAHHIASQLPCKMLRGKWRSLYVVSCGRITRVSIFYKWGSLHPVLNWNFKSKASCLLESRALDYQRLAQSRPLEEVVFPRV